MCSLHDDDIDERPVRDEGLEAPEHAREQEHLLRRAEAGGGARGEHDRARAVAHTPSTVTEETTTGSVGSCASLPSSPIFSTTSRPSVTRPTTA